MTGLAERLVRDRRLETEEYEALIRGRTPALARELARLAQRERRRWFGDRVFTRGLIEITNVCRNDCYYCGIRRSNRACDRYRLSPEDILACCAEGWALGFRTFVLQGGEDGYYTDEVLCPLLETIKARWPDCAVTLSLGERSRESYRRLYEAGADRYLLRHETADPDHYASLHPPAMSYHRRMDCLSALRELGYQVGCGFMVGSPGQTPAHLARDLAFLQDFRPEMCGIGPFLPQKDTPFGGCPPGSGELTCFLLSVLRLMLPKVLLPATTALGTLDPLGREKGLQAGANVVMPNLSPTAVRRKYALYDNKICTGEESAQCRGCLEARVASVGFTLVSERGDAPGFPSRT